MYHKKIVTIILIAVIIIPLGFLTFKYFQKKSPNAAGPSEFTHTNLKRKPPVARLSSKKRESLKQYKANLNQKMGQGFNSDRFLKKMKKVRNISEVEKLKSKYRRIENPNIKMMIIEQIRSIGTNKAFSALNDIYKKNLEQIPKDFDQLAPEEIFNTIGMNKMILMSMKLGDNKLQQKIRFFKKRMNEIPEDKVIKNKNKVLLSLLPYLMLTQQTLPLEDITIDYYKQLVNHRDPLVNFPARMHAAVLQKTGKMDKLNSKFPTDMIKLIMYPNKKTIKTLKSFYNKPQLLREVLRNQDRLRKEILRFFEKN